jgi:acyl-CoA synthetase (AMP-forming)/AMP-acid ligase II
MSYLTSGNPVIEPYGAVKASRKSETFSEILRDRAREYPNRTAFVYLGRDGAEVERVTFSELDRRVDAIAAELVLQGLSGCNAILIYPPGLEFVAALYACFRAGVIAVPVPFTAGRRSEDRVSAICRDADAVAILTQSSFGAAQEIRMILNAAGLSPSWLTSDTFAARTTAPAAAKTNQNVIAMLQYTSGSTGRPKGVMGAVSLMRTALPTMQFAL